MRKFGLSLAASIACFFAIAQSPSVVTVAEVTRIENALASDDMRGRKAGTPDADRAADFIASEFKKAGLQPYAGNSFFQEFTLYNTKLKLLKFELDDKEENSRRVIVISTKPEVKVNEKSGYTISKIPGGVNWFEPIMEAINGHTNTIVMIDSSFSSKFPRLVSLKQNLKTMDHDVVFILGSTLPAAYTVKFEQELKGTNFKNVVGVLPGHSKQNEYVIFSGHYDHLGIERKPESNDSIYNGANDDAAGITAVISLAEYYAKRKNNERSIVFAAFTAEEMGTLGSQFFSEKMDAPSVMAMFNIEMIGTESKWGKNSAYITGYDRTNLGTIMQKNLKGSAFTFYPDPYPEQDLFFRSDNATLAQKGVPAHTISTAKMEDEPNYHKLTDEVSTLDLGNMTSIITSIAVAAESVVQGKDTPSRVK